MAYDPLKRLTEALLQLQDAVKSAAPGIEVSEITIKALDRRAPDHFGTVLRSSPSWLQHYSPNVYVGDPDKVAGVLIKFDNPKHR